MTNDETVGPYIATISTYVKLRPTGFIVSGFDINYGDLPQTVSTVFPTDTVAYVPAYFSYDMDALTDQKTLEYQFFCILADIEAPTQSSNVSLNFATELYSIKNGKPITLDQFESPDTCFKDDSK